MKNTILRVCLSTVMLLATSGYATAQEIDQDQDITVNCTTGAYGQIDSCTVDALQSADQRIVFRADGTAIKVHDPVNTGLDTKTTAATVATMATGAVALALKKKNRIA